MEDRRSRKRDKTRHALLGSALELFAEKGIYEPSIGEITAHADVGKGTFYQYFASREVLIAELVEGGFDLLLAEVQGRVSNAPEGAERLPLILEAHSAFFEEHPNYLLLFHQARGWMKMARHHSASLRGAFSNYVQNLGAVAGVAPRTDAEPCSRQAIVLAGFIAGVLSFDKILGFPRGSGRLSHDFALLAEVAPRCLGPGRSDRP